MATNRLHLDAEHRAIYDELGEYLFIDPNDLRGEIAGHGAKYAFLAVHYSIVKSRRDNAKLVVERVKAAQFVLSKMSSFEDGTGKVSGVTDTLAKAYVDVDSEVLKCKNELSHAETDLALWDNIMAAMEQKSYMLTKLADLEIMERRTEAETFNGQTREDMTKSMNTMANMDAKRDMNMRKRQAKLESIRKPKPAGEEPAEE